MAPDDRFAPEKAEADLMRRRAEAIAKRLRKEWTFQQPLADRPDVEDMESDPDKRRRREEGRALANEQYTGSYGKLTGISKEEVEEIRNRGPKRDQDGKYIETQQSEVVVPTRSKESYQAPAKLGEDYANEETEQGEWRRNWANQTRTRYLRGDDQDAIRLQVSEVEDEEGEPATRLTRRDAPTGVDTSNATGGSFSGSEQGREIFAMDTKGSIYATDPKNRIEQDEQGRPVDKRTHHSSLVHGEDVIGAGEIQIEDGLVTEVTDLSGHYRPSPAQMADTINEMEAQGVPMIDSTGKRAMVDLKGNERATGRSTEMDFERFSQTGGNVEQIRRKKKMVDELDRLSDRLRDGDDEDESDDEGGQVAAPPGGVYKADPGPVIFKDNPELNPSEYRPTNESGDDEDEQQRVAVEGVYRTLEEVRQERESRDPFADDEEDGPEVDPRALLGKAKREADVQRERDAERRRREQQGRIAALEDDDEDDEDDDFDSEDGPSGGVDPEALRKYTVQSTSEPAAYVADTTTDND